MWGDIPINSARMNPIILSLKLMVGNELWLLKFPNNAEAASIFLERVGFDND